MDNKLLKFFRLSCKDKLLLMEAVILTGAARVSIILIPFRKLSAFMGKCMAESSYKESEAACANAKKIGWAVAAVSSSTPWKSNCFVQALSALIMLKRRKINSTLYFGVTKGKGNELIAHAWLRTGTKIITGEEECKWFTIVARFSSEFGGRS